MRVDRRGFCDRHGLSAEVGALIEFRRLCAQPQHPLLPEACDLWLSPAEKRRQRRLIEFRPVRYEMPVRRRRSRVAAAVLAMLALRH